MKKLMYLLAAGTLFIFTACNSGTSDAAATEEAVVEAADAEVVVACADDCAKACCLGCKATEGEKSCDLLASGDHSCCAVKEDAPNTHEGDAGDHPHPH